MGKKKNKAEATNDIETTNNKKSKKPFYKKWWSWLIAIIIICSCCSCASGNSDDDSEEEDVAISEDTETNDEEESSEDTETNDEEESSDDKDSSDNEEDSNDDTEIVVVDNNECAITLTGIDSDNEEGYAMTFSFENKSSVSNYGLMIPYAEISGVEIDPAYFNVFDAGDCEEDTIIFPTDELEKTGINEISEIGLYIWVFDYDAADDVDGWRENTVVNETYCIYPDGEETAETVEYVGADTDIVFLDNENMKVSVTEVKEQDDGYVVNMYVKNKTDRIMQCGFAHENGTIFYYILMPGAWTLMQEEISESTLSEIGVTDFSLGIENINLIFIATDWLATTFEEDYTEDVIFAYTNFTIQSLIDGEEPEDSSDEEVEEDTTNTESEETDEEMEEDTTNTESEDTSEITLEYEQAVAKAESYLDFSAFSYTGLIEQLEYVGFSTEEATYAADNCGADWYEQAAAKAESYLKYSAFSYTGLIEQLEYVGFSSEEATYAADNCGADWNEQAVAKAESYLEFTSFSRSELIDQLEYVGFTSEQAEYAADAVGY